MPWIPYQANHIPNHVGCRSCSELYAELRHLNATLAAERVRADAAEAANRRLLAELEILRKGER